MPPLISRPLPGFLARLAGTPLPPAGNLCRQPVFTSPPLRQNRRMKHSFFTVFVAGALSALPAAAADPAVVDLSTLQDVAVRHARQQTRDLPGKVTITPGSLSAPTLAPCQAMEPFTPAGSRLIGKTHIGVRCLGPASWTILVPIQITATAQYVVTVRPLIAGQTVQASDLSVQTGELSRLPTGAIADPASAIGKTIRNSLGSGAVLRGDALQEPLIIRQGQSVRVISRGEGFSVSSEGRALTNAAQGQSVQIRMPGGQTVQGTARNDGSVEISF